MVDASGVIIGIITLGVVLFLLAVIFYMMSRESTPEIENPNPPPVIPAIPSALLYACTQDSDCESGLKCDEYLRECRVKNGGSCFQASDCLSGSYCSGVCVNKSTLSNAVSGISNDPCPCRYGFECVADLQNPALNVCLKFEGVECTQGSECVSGRCGSDGKCAELLGNSTACQGDSQCEEENCSLGYCQAQGTTTGDEFAACRAGGPGCDEGFVCSSGGVCVPAISGLLYTCNDSVGCPLYYDCYRIPSTDKNGNYPDPGSTDGFKECLSGDLTCGCLYRYDTSTGQPTPNQASTLEACGSGFVYDNGECLPMTGQSCGAGGRCANGGTCGDKKVLYRIDTQNEGYPISGLVGATDLKYTSLEVPDSVEISRVDGCTVGFVPADQTSGDAQPDLGYDVLYLQTISESIPSNTYPADHPVLYRWTSDNQVWSNYLTFKFVINGVQYQFVNADTCAMYTTDTDGTHINFDRLIVVCTILSGDHSGKSALVYSDGDGIFYPYRTADGRQRKSDGDLIDKFDDVSVTWDEGQQWQNILLTRYRDNDSTVYWFNVRQDNGDNDKFHDRRDYVGGANPILAKLNFGIAQDSKTQEFFSFPVMSFISGQERRYIKFSGGLGTKKYTSYQGVELPMDTYGFRPDTLDTNVYSLAAVDPLVTGVQNGLFVAYVNDPNTGTLYTYSTGAQIAIQGHFGRDAKPLATTANMYIVSQHVCE